MAGVHVVGAKWLNIQKESLSMAADTFDLISVNLTRILVLRLIFPKVHLGISLNNFMLFQIFKRLLCYFRKYRLLMEHNS